MSSPPIHSSNSSSQRETTLATMFKVEEGLLIKELPPPPPELNEEGGRWWNYYVGILIEGRCMSRMFITAMTNLCIAHMIRDCIMHELRNGLMLDIEKYDPVTGETTYTSKLNPLVGDLEDILIKMNTLLVSMGMTAYSAKVNNIDTKGNLTSQKTTSGPPKVTIPRPTEES